MLTLNLWEGPNDYIRIYVIGLTDKSKPFFTLSRGGGAKVGFQSGGSGGSDAQAIEQIVAQTFQFSMPLKWVDLLSVAKTDFRSIKGKKIDVRTTVSGTQAAGAFTAEAELEIDEDLRSNPIPVPTTLLVDHREPDELKRRLAGFTNLIVEEQALDVGDFSIPGVITFERKSAHDLGVSVTADSKRLFHQVERMILEPGRSIFLIEGDLYRDSGLKQASVDGVLSYLTMQGAVPIRTLSLPHTAYMIAKLLRHHAYGLGYSIDLRGSAPKNAPIERKAVFLVEGLPGVSNRLAKALLSHFGTVQALSIATAAELRAVDGIGATKADDIAAIFRQDVKSALALIPQD